MLHFFKINISTLLNSSSQSSINEINQESSIAENERRSSLSRMCPTLPPSPLFAPSEAASASDAEPPQSASLADVTPPKPPDRPPKKAALRSLFQPPQDVPEEPSTPQRPYFYRKPPAPDPPVSPPLSPPPPLPPPPSSSALKDITSRSSTPELPPPPPPPPQPAADEAELIIIRDEPLPPPPPATTTKHEAKHATNTNELKKDATLNAIAQPTCNGTYHKDSYMAHRKDWKTGYEGRYRRTQSPSSAERRETTAPGRDYAINGIKPIKNSTAIGKTPVSIHANGNLRSAVSTSSLLQSPSSFTTSYEKDSFFSDHYNNNSNGISNNNRWHNHQKSTTVDFTAEELCAFHARRAAVENDSSSRISSEGTPPPPLRPIVRAASLAEPLHLQHLDAAVVATLPDVVVSGVSGAHDGTVMARPATVVVVEEGLDSTPPHSPPRTPPSPPPSSASSSLSSASSFRGPPTPPPISDGPISPSAVSLLLPSAHSSSTLTSLALTTEASTVSSSFSIPTSPEKVSSPITSPSSTSLSKSLLTTTGTCASLRGLDNGNDTTSQRCNIVVLTYGRRPRPEVAECDLLSAEFVSSHRLDQKLRALLAQGPPYKSMANYMSGVFMLEMRRDLLRGSHATHPDLTVSDSTTNGVANSRTTPSPFTLSSNGVDEPKEAPPPPFIVDPHSLKKKKDELIQSISRKMETLLTERSAIRDEMGQNADVGKKVTSRVEGRAKSAETDKFKLHVGEIDKITALLLGLSGRLARTENAIISSHDEKSEQKKVLEDKRDKLSEQLEEAKKLKENIDRRAVQVSRILTQYFNEEEFAEYDHFIKMKAKLLMDSREIDDKIRLSEEQIQALAGVTTLIEP